MQKQRMILKAKRRSVIGKSRVKALRRQGELPAVFYGSATGSIPLALSFKEFEAVIHTRAGANVLLTLQIEGEKKPAEHTVIVKEVQHDPVSDTIQHVDLHAISLTERLAVNVPLAVRGESLGVKEGGVLDVVHHEIEIECLPADIPERIEVDVSAMAIGSSIHVRELTFPKGVACLLGPEEVVVAVHAPRKEEEAPAAEAPSEPELVGREKKEKEEEAAAPAAPAAPKAAKEKEKEKEGSA